MKDVELPEEIDLSGSGNLYQFIPLRLFTETRHLNLSSTSISNRHFQQIATVAKNLERLDISNCPSLDQICIFQAKKDLDQLRHVDISGNHKFTILAIACLCSLENLQMLLAHGFKLTPEQLLFLTKTFSSVSSGTLQLETEDGFDAACVMNTFAKELFDDELLFT